MKTPQEETEEDVLEAKKDAHASDASKPSLTDAEVTRLAELQAK